MNFEHAKKLIIYSAMLFFALAAMVFFVAGDGFRYENVKSDTLSAISTIGELTDSDIVEQRIQIVAEKVTSVELQMTAFGRETGGVLHVDVVQDNQIISSGEKEVSGVADGSFVQIALDEPIVGKRNEYVVLEITTANCDIGREISLYYGNSIKAGRFDIVKSVQEEDLFRVNGESGAGMICVYLNGINSLSVYKYYWPGILLVFAVMAYCVQKWWKQAKTGKANPLTHISISIDRYNFLLRQLVGRDFKTKYKRSVLGVGWSFLNPLLTMAVQFVVFSTLFSNGTKNYPVYLLSGIVLFSFFNEAVGMGMTSITGNAPLIKKVYVPKYIYPVSKVCSSLINLGTSFIPLVLVMLLTGVWPKVSMLLLIFDFLCLITFVTGMVLILSTCMTFFQDTQFLWSVVSMLWMYLTPIFYPDTIIPAKFLTLYHLNPMYQYITFARVCIIEGTTPAPTAYLWCILSSVVVFLLGVMIFKRNQDKFVLYL